MDKADFLEQFTSYNELIENALISQNFDRVVSLDVARREMLHKFTKNNSPDQDLHFFKCLEKCAEDNAKSISMMIEEMQDTGDVWFAPLEDIAAHCRSLHDSGALTLRRDDLPYYGGASPLPDPLPSSMPKDD